MHLRRKDKNVIVLLNRVVRLFIQALREIFDETAYRRFLGPAVPSRENYAAFRREREEQVCRRPKCC